MTKKYSLQDSFNTSKPIFLFLKFLISNRQSNLGRNGGLDTILSHIFIFEWYHIVVGQNVRYVSVWSRDETDDFRLEVQ
jgi:hypothetical protein